METFTKTTAYAKLTEIRNTGVDTTKYFREVANSDTVPYSTMIFINRYQPIPQLYTYNKIYERRKNNPLYKNLVNEDIDISDMAIALSSLQTQILIHMKELINDNQLNDAEEYADLMNMKLISESLQDYCVTGQTDKMENTFFMIREVFKRLFS